MRPKQRLPKVKRQLHYNMAGLLGRKWDEEEDGGRPEITVFLSTYGSPFLTRHLSSGSRRSSGPSPIHC